MYHLILAVFIALPILGLPALAQPTQPTPGCVAFEITDSMNNASSNLPSVFIGTDSRVVRACAFPGNGTVGQPIEGCCLQEPPLLWQGCFDNRCVFSPYAVVWQFFDRDTDEPCSEEMVNWCIEFSPATICGPGNWQLRYSITCGDPNEGGIVFGPFSWDFSVFTSASIVAEYRDAGCECSNESNPNDPNSAADWVQALPNGTSPIGTCLEREWRIRVIVDPSTVHLEGHPEHQYAGSATWTWSGGPLPLQDPYPDYWFVDSCMELYPGWECPRSILPANGLFTAVRARFPLGADESYTTNAVNF